MIELKVSSAKLSSKKIEEYNILNSEQEVIGNSLKLKSLKDDRLLEESYFNNESKLHREGAPAYITYNHRGLVEKEEFFFNDVYHNENGPAVIEWSDGKVINEVYFINGEQIEFENNFSSNMRYH
jgi:hypothetical protein